MEPETPLWLQQQRPAPAARVRQPRDFSINLNGNLTSKIPVETAVDTNASLHSDIAPMASPMAQTPSHSATQTPSTAPPNLLARLKAAAQLSRSGQTPRSSPALAHTPAQIHGSNRPLMMDRITPLVNRTTPATSQRPILVPVTPFMRKSILSAPRQQPSSAENSTPFNGQPNRLHVYMIRKKRHSDDEMDLDALPSYRFNVFTEIDRILAFWHYLIQQQQTKSKAIERVDNLFTQSMLQLLEKVRECRQLEVTIKQRRSQQWKRRLEVLQRETRAQQLKRQVEQRKEALGMANAADSGNAWESWKKSLLS